MSLHFSRNNSRTISQSCRYLSFLAMHFLKYFHVFFSYHAEALQILPFDKLPFPILNGHVEQQSDIQFVSLAAGTAGSSGSDIKRYLATFFRIRSSRLEVKEHRWYSISMVINGRRRAESR